MLFNLSGVVHAQDSQPSVYSSAMRHDGHGRVVGTIAPDPDGALSTNGHLATRVFYDPAGLVVRTEAGSLAAWQPSSVAPVNWTGFTINRTQHFSYDTRGRLVTAWTVDIGGVVSQITQTNYDRSSRPGCTATRMNPASYGGAPAFASLPLNACTAVLDGPFGPDRVSRNVYDAAGQVLQIRRAVGTSLEQAEVTYSYTLGGQKQDIIDANGNRAQMGYNGHNRLQFWVLPSPTRPAAYNDTTPASALATAGATNPSDFEQYGYDAAGNRTALRKRDGSVISYSYDRLGRTTLKAIPQRSGLPGQHARAVHYGYDLRGLQTFARFDGVTGEGVSTSYDGFGRNTGETTNLGGVSRTVSYRYDAASNRARITHPDGAFFTGEYDYTNRLTRIRENGAGALVTLGYDSQGRRNSMTAGYPRSNGYDPAGRLNDLTLNPSAAAYDVTRTFEYNPASQIKRRTVSNDAYASTAHYNVDRPYTTNGLNQYVSAGPATFSHDANGNLISDGTATFLYDIENRMVIATGAKPATLTYDPLGRLWQVVDDTNGAVTRFGYDGDALIGEYNGAGALKRRYTNLRGL